MDIAAGYWCGLEDGGDEKGDDGCEGKGERKDEGNEGDREISGLVMSYKAQLKLS